MTTDSSNGQSYTIPLPVVSYPESLPIDDPNLPWDRFEAFCEELISRLPGVKETHRYGRSGSRQRGIDIFADLDSGERWAFQCRQWKKFTQTDATRAIRETTYPADRFILTLSRHATSGVRDACDGHSNWDVWDVGDISRKVREMELDSAARLVESHFGPAWRKAFLGLQGLTPFVAPIEFFRPFLNESALFNHMWQLVGRSDHTRQSHEFIESQQQNVAILVGRGGIGKSKILHALAESFDAEHEGISLWFMAEGVHLTQDGVDHLPYKPCVVVVDDAHRRSDLPTLLALRRQRPHVVKLILSCRPQGVGHLKAQLAQGGFDVHETVDLPIVNELSRDEVTELGRQALGAEFEHLAEQLAAATWDCPLVTVIGGQLLAQRAIPPRLLERDEEFRQTVLTRFQDVLVGEVGDRIEANLCKSLLSLISAIQPIRLDNEKALDAEADFLNVTRPLLLLSLGVLEEAGVLLRRGNTLRIVPDVLADHILHQVSVMPQGQKTGYADTVFHQFASLCPTEVLRNLAELDWRLRQSGTQAADLLGDVWHSIGREFQDASNRGRTTILEILEQVALYQPEETLELVEYALRNPAMKSEDPELSVIYEFTHNDVLRLLPTLLRRISYTLDFIPRCFNLLWELGRDDGRDLNSNPDHPMRVLTELASYDIGKPFVVNHLVLDNVERLLEAPDSHGHIHSPLEIIDPMLAKAGHSTRSDGHSLIIRRFAIERDDVEPIRARAVALIVGCLSSHNLKVMLRALESLGNALQEPIGASDISASDENRDSWRPEQLEILTTIGDLALRLTEPMALIRIKKVLWWHRNYSPSNAVRDKAKAIVASIPESFELQLTEELMDPFRSRDPLPDEREGDDGFKRHQERIAQTQRALVAELLSRLKEADRAYSVLTDRIQIITEAGIRPEPQVLLGILGDLDPELAAGLCNLIIEDPNGVLTPYLHALLSQVRVWNTEQARVISQRALEGRSNTLSRAVALSYHRWGWADRATADDVEHIRKLLRSEDLYARRLAIGSLGYLAESSPRIAIDLAKNVELCEDASLASELCRLFYEGWGISFSELSADDLEALLLSLEDVPDIDDLHINGFLGKASQLDDTAVVKFLLKRIRKQHDGSSRYDALPVLGFQEPLVGLSTGPNKDKALRELRDASLESAWSVVYWIPKLFGEVSAGFGSDVSFEVLDEWINTGSADKIMSVAHLLEGAHPTFVFRHIEFTSNLLERAHLAGDDTYRSVIRSLASSVLLGTRSGTSGEPMPQDVAIRDDASAVARRFDAGSPAYRFYTLLVEGAEGAIRDQLLRDEELFE